MRSATIASCPIFQLMMNPKGNKPVRGTYDLLPGPAARNRRFLASALELLEKAGFRELETPLIEEAALFNRTSGQASDIVSKEMFRVSHAGPGAGRDDLVLRPEGTAPLVRAYLASFHHHNPAGRFFYCGPMFRYNRPQKGRYRQFRQLGVEIFDADAPQSDAECLWLLDALMKATGLDWPPIRLNSLGCRSCQERFRPLIAGFLAGRESGLCPDCLARRERNPLRVLDCPRPGCRETVSGGPLMEECLCVSCREHFERVQSLASILGVAFELDRRLVRGLDYYTRTVFEVTVPGGGNAVAAGGRYDELVSDLGGRPTPALGFALGLERFLERLPVTGPARSGARIVFLDEPGRSDSLEAALGLMLRLRGESRVPVTISDRSAARLKSQLSAADRDGCRFALIIGSREIERGEATVRDLETGEQGTVPFGQVAAFLER